MCENAKILCPYCLTREIDPAQAICSACYSKEDTFPRHLLTVISCASIIVILILGMQKRWKTRILSAATTVLLTAGVIIWAVLNERVI